MQHQQEQQQQQLLEHQVLTQELIKDLTDLLSDHKQEVRHGTLNLILQYTTLSESKRKFKDTNIIQLLIKNIFTKQLTTACLSNLINLSSEECFYDKLAPIIEPLLIESRNWTGLELELTLLLLINLSKVEQCSDIIIGKEDKEGYFIQILYKHLSEKMVGSHIANIYSNITSFENGRKLFAKKCLPNKLKQFLYTEERERRVGILKTIRNTLFEWENNQFITELLAENNHFIDDIVVYLGFFLLSSEHLIKDKQAVTSLVEKFILFPYQKRFPSASFYMQKQKQELILAVEILLILTNVDFHTLKPVYKKQEFRGLLQVISTAQLQQQHKDKLQALQVFFC